MHKRTINLFHDIYFTRWALNVMLPKTRYSFCLIYDEEWPLIVWQLSLTQSIFRCKRVMTWTLRRRADLSIYTYDVISGEWKSTWKSFRLERSMNRILNPCHWKFPEFRYFLRVCQYKGCWINKIGKACVVTSQPKRIVMWREMQRFIEQNVSQCDLPILFTSHRLRRSQRPATTTDFCRNIFRISHKSSRSFIGCVNLLSYISRHQETYDYPLQCVEYPLHRKISQKFEAVFLAMANVSYNGQFSKQN